MISSAVQSKADQLVNEDCVRELEGAKSYFIRSSSGRYYVVVIHALGAFCNCDASTTCSHIVAAKRVAEWEGSS